VIMFSVLFDCPWTTKCSSSAASTRSGSAPANNRVAVATGQAATGRVITARQHHILVFLSFLLNGTSSSAVRGGLAAAIIIDAFVVRTVLVPRSCTCFGRINCGCRSGSTAGCPPCTSRAMPIRQPQAETRRASLPGVGSETQIATVRILGCADPSS